MPSMIKNFQRSASTHATPVSASAGTRRAAPSVPAARLALGALLCAGAALLAASPVRADTPPPQGVVNLNASASVEVPKDWISVTLSTQREGADAGPVQTALKQALDAALQEARKAAKPGQVEVQTGNFSLSPRYTQKGQTNGWQGTAELVIEGRDMATIGQLTGRITTLTINRVGYGLSREQRQKAEADVTSQAVANYRTRAAEAAKLFGYGSYVIREVSVNSNEPPVMVQMARGKAMAAMAPTEDALPVEAGKAVVTVNVNGSVQLLK